ncbi:MAG: amidohydrolase family protein, partial [Chloroflexi bacterium]|nr:amidohydrolase family protein [Chloroflexota bacterium]
MTQFHLISVDDHVLEPPDLWTSRLPASFGDRTPRVMEAADGTQSWSIGGRTLPLTGRGSIGAALADRASSPRRWSEIPPAVSVPAERLRAMDADGVDVSVLYPSVAGMAGETLGQIEDPELELACVRAYNDWLVDTWAAASPRFIPQCLVPLAPIEAAVTELRRAVARGHRGLVFPAVPVVLRDVPHLNEPAYDPLWSACEELR